VEPDISILRKTGHFYFALTATVGALRQPMEYLFLVSSF